MRTLLKNTTGASLLIALAMSFSACELHLASAESHHYTPVTDPFFTPQDLSNLTVSRPPPGKGSKEWTEDLMAVHEWQKKRTGAQCQEADHERRPGFREMFGAPHHLLSEAEVTRLEPFFDRILNEAGAAVEPLKKRTNRLRPFAEDTRIRPCIAKPESKSYPSGHATLAMLYARILSQLHPELQEKFIQRAKASGLNRVIGGVHYPTDVEEGFKLAERMMSRLTESPKFRAELMKLKAQ